MAWFTRKVLARRISNTLEADFCLEALNEAIHKFGPPEIMNTDQGSQFASFDWTDRLKRAKTKISMDGMRAAAKKFKDAGTAPIAFGYAERWTGNHLFNHLTLRLGGAKEYANLALQIFDASAKPEGSWSSPGEVKARELSKGLLDDGFFTPGYLSDDYPTASNLFLTGKAPMFSMGSWFLGNTESTAPNGSFGVMAFPTAGRAPGLQTDLVTNGLVVAVTATSNHPDEATVFLDCLLSEPVQKKWSEATQRLLPYTCRNHPVETACRNGRGWRKARA